MGHVGCEISPRDLGRPHPAEIAGDLGVAMQRDEVGEVILAQPFGGQAVGGEMVHGDRSPLPRRVVVHAAIAAG